MVVIVTFVSVADAVVRFTSNTRAVPSVSFASEIEIPAVSSSTIVPVPSSVLPLGRVAVIMNCSSFSSIVSSVVVTVTVIPVSPARIVTGVIVSV